MRGAVLAGLMLASTAAQADPVTYQGTLGNAPIVAEFTRDPAKGLDGMAGRYFYRRVGGDIPLRAGKAGLAEEQPCSTDACPQGGPGPDGARWDIATADDGQTLSGTWKGDKPLPIQLSRVGTRAAGGEEAKTPDDLFEHSVSLTFSDTAITLATEPYDALRLEADFATEPGITGPGGTTTFAVDPRTKFPFPRIERLASGDPAAANAALARRQGAFSLDAFQCLAGQYPSFAEPGADRFFGGGTLAGYDSDFTTEVSALAAHALSWTESGSLFCGGAHPSNFTTSQTMDVTTGRLLQTADILAGITDGTPSDALLRFVRERRPKPESDEDKQFETDCGIDDLLSQGLAARFGQEDGKTTLVFALEGLPHAIAACEGDLFSIPLAEAKPWLKPKAFALAGGN